MQKQVSAKEAFGINGCVSALAQALLTRGGIAELENYIKGLRCRFDAYCASINIKLPSEIETELANTCKQRIDDPNYANETEVYKPLYDKFSMTEH